MTSMIDVVFLLLIFFMTTASFVKTERDLDSTIKVNEKSAAQASDLEPAIVEIVAGGTGFVFRVGSRELIAGDELTNVLRAFPNKLDGAFVRVSDGAPFEMAAVAIQACKDADFVSVSYVPID
ncbi:MAG: biopolymer transporter ExbD [Planctomycetes bacterium]|nr:biopolymer transporter ExbD [Planctomycetota bacterium]